MHAGDDRNALSAWSFLGPYDTSRLSNGNGEIEEDETKVSRVGPPMHTCDGRCGTM